MPTIGGVKKLPIGMNPYCRRKTGPLKLRGQKAPRVYFLQLSILVVRILFDILPQKAVKGCGIKADRVVQLIKHIAKRLLGMEYHVPGASPGFCLHKRSGRSCEGNPRPIVHINRNAVGSQVAAIEITRFGVKSHLMGMRTFLAFLVDA